jgi:hypothetical protein
MIRANETTMPVKTSTPVTTQTTQPSAPSTPTVKLTRAQQIRALKEAMADEEQSEYLDARDMGQDFWSARA